MRSRRIEFLEKKKISIIDSLVSEKISQGTMPF